MLLSYSAEPELLIQRLKNTLEEGSDLALLRLHSSLECMVQNYTGGLMLCPFSAS